MVLALFYAHADFIDLGDGIKLYTHRRDPPQHTREKVCAELRRYRWMDVRLPHLQYTQCSLMQQVQCNLLVILFFHCRFSLLACVHLGLVSVLYMYMCPSLLEMKFCSKFFPPYYSFCCFYMQWRSLLDQRYSKCG